MITKDRYNFDQRFNQIAERVLSLNGVIPRQVQDNNTILKPSNFEQYQMMSDPDYELLKQANFMTDSMPNNQINSQANIFNVNNPISQPTVPQQQYQNPLSYSMNFNQNQANKYPNNVNQSYSTPQKQSFKKKENIREQISNLNKDQLDQYLKQNIMQMNRPDNILINDNIDPENDDQIQEVNNQQENIQPERQLKRNQSTSLQAGEMILQQQKMFEALQQQQFQFQQELMLRQQEMEYERRRRKLKKQQEKEMQQILEPLIKTQQQLMETLIQKIEQKQNNSQNFNQLKYQEDALAKELEYRKKIAQQQHEIQLKKLEQERIISQQNLQLQTMMMPNLLNLYSQTPFNQMNPMMNKSINPNLAAAPYNMQSPFAQLPQQGQQNNLPKFGDIPQKLFTNPKSNGDQLIEEFLRDMKK
ncbi:hypothetical protein TTHERM_00653880 (macronuclear) [Tetrahymena thermophila SB210]|uniref:Uncharacterized protein n=1 Tax=Tetrahymena thermophila (strain SB210) TaxID=312017 RepID=Q23AY9_TETTS|nr:hypothetical protein TTHERM_00653880 [Tetrahymena thermophila SB210]EAR93695.1 hypothetical protein TTHERM_00653880 [Tetrahymena thermophila SB210]|eukprot:XP_001013940.1 hypothetical protein TTHERM_00653880 [Tetrahymena thermophila SB210]